VEGLGAPARRAWIEDGQNSKSGLDLFCPNRHNSSKPLHHHHGIKPKATLFSISPRHLLTQTPIQRSASAASLPDGRPRLRVARDGSSASLARKSPARQTTVPGSPQHFLPHVRGLFGPTFWSRRLNGRGVLTSTASTKYQMPSSLRKLATTS